MRKALVVGINDYPSSPLKACINDAAAFGVILETNGDGSPNFDVRLYTDVQTKGELIDLIADLFAGEMDISLLYFAGHGFENELGGYLVTPDDVRKRNKDMGVALEDVLKIANNSKAKNRIVILDCCHSGVAGTSKLLGANMSFISNGVTILTACKDDESAMEVNGHGIYY